MPNAEPRLPAAAVETLARWHEMVAKKDMSDLPSITDPDAVFRSPTVLKGFESAPALKAALTAAISVFEDFAYHREFATDDGRSVILEFSARVGEKKLKGVDIIRFGDDGRIVEFEVMVRPINALQALYEAMSAKLGATLVAYKGDA